MSAAIAAAIALTVVLPLCSADALAAGVPVNGTVLGIPIDGTAMGIHADGTAHSLEYRPAVSAGCTENGSKEYWFCPLCGGYFADAGAAVEIAPADTVIPAAGHIISYVSASDAGCDRDGAKEHYVCLVCGAIFGSVDGSVSVSASDIVLPAVGHELKHVSATDAECKTDGKKEHYVCLVCGRLFTDSKGTGEVSASDVVVPMTGHTVAVVSATDAGCETNGNKLHYRCVACDALFSDSAGTKEVSESDVVVPAKGHTPERVRAVAATCEKSGTAEHWRCTECGKLFADKNCRTETTAEKLVIPATGHDWDSGTVTVRATYRAEGKRVYTCRNDSSHTRSESIGKLKENKNYAFSSSGYSWTMRSGKSLTVTVKNSSDDSGTYADFDELEVDGKVLDSKYYSTEKGSLKVTFKSSWLETLSKGSHKLTVYFIDGAASSTVTVKSSGSGSNPSTGDSRTDSGLVLATLLFTLALGYVSYIRCGEMRIGMFAASAPVAGAGSDGKDSAHGGEARCVRRHAAPHDTSCGISRSPGKEIRYFLGMPCEKRSGSDGK